MDKLVEFRDPLGAAAKQFLPRLRSAFLVETAAVAERLAKENPRYHFVTFDGTCYHGRMVSGGRAGGGGAPGVEGAPRPLDAQTQPLERAAAEPPAEPERAEAERRASELGPSPVDPHHAGA